MAEILRPTADDELARALHDRHRPSALLAMARAYEDALSRCGAHPARGQWLARLADVHAHTRNDDAAAHALRSMVCDNRHPFVGPLLLAAQSGEAFDDPYAGCVAGEVAPLDAPARDRLADAWMRVGAHDADSALPLDGFWAQRAISAFRQAAAVGRPEQQTVAQVAEARMLYRQERLAAAFALYARLLDAHEHETGPTLYPEAATGGASGLLSRAIVAESIVSAASALAAVDFEGPPELAPATPRPDPLSKTGSRAEMSAMLRVALERMNDPRWLPDDREWGAAVGMQLAHLFSDLHLTALSDDAYAILNRRWPLYRHRPTALFEQASRLGSAEDGAAQAAVKTDLERTVSPGSAWMTKYGSDAEALLLARPYQPR